MDWMTVSIWVFFGSLAAFVLLSVPYALYAKADVDAIHARFRKHEPALWRAKGGPIPPVLPWNRRNLGYISRLLHDLDGVTDPELLATMRGLRRWARYETYVLTPLLLLVLLSGIAWGSLRQMLVR